jgi:hypothetical protein
MRRSLPSETPQVIADVLRQHPEFDTPEFREGVRIPDFGDFPEMSPKNPEMSRKVPEIYPPFLPLICSFLHFKEGFLHFKEGFRHFLLFRNDTATNGSVESFPVLTRP